MSLYEALAKAETGGVKGSKYVRTSEIPDEGSTAYGPVQITRGLAEGYRDNHASKFTAAQLVYLDAFIAQADLFNDYGNNPAHAGDTTTLAGYDKKYDYGGKGDLHSEANKKLYVEIAKIMVKDAEDSNKGDFQAMLNEWHFGKEGAKTKDRSDHIDYSVRALKEYSRLHPTDAMSKTVAEIADIEATDVIREKLPELDTLPDTVKTALVASVRHDDTILKSPKALGLIASGRYAAASTEFLNSKKYTGKEAKAKDKTAMKALADVLDVSSDDNEAQLSGLPTATSEGTPTSSSEPLSEVLPSTPSPTIPEENSSEEFSEEDMAFLRSLQGERATSSEVLKQEATLERTATEAEAEFTGEELEFLKSLQVRTNTKANREAGYEVEGQGGREERVSKKFDEEEEEEVLLNLF